jgi:hypothetical protein
VDLLDVLQGSALSATTTTQKLLDFDYIMILSTHAIVGGAIASLMPSHPVFAFFTGVASHFAIDAIPHVDYPLYSITVRRSANSALTLNWLLLQDFGLITLDAFAGLAIVLWLYAPPGAITAVLAGALGAMLPDPLQLLQKLYPREPLSVCPKSS